MSRFFWRPTRTWEQIKADILHERRCLDFEAEAEEALRRDSAAARVAQMLEDQERRGYQDPGRDTESEESGPEHRDRLENREDDLTDYYARQDAALRRRAERDRLRDYVLFGTPVDREGFGKTYEERAREVADHRERNAREGNGGMSREGV